MLSKSIILSFLKEHKAYLKSEFDVDSIALFGSYARGDEKKDSDVDILVDMKASFDNFFDLKYFLEDNLHARIDLGKEKNLRLLVKKQIKDELIYA
jgi:uncharacterized protein